MDNVTLFYTYYRLTGGGQISCSNVVYIYIHIYYYYCIKFNVWKLPISQIYISFFLNYELILILLILSTVLIVVSLWKLKRSSDSAGIRHTSKFWKVSKNKLTKLWVRMRGKNKVFNVYELMAWQLIFQSLILHENLYHFYILQCHEYYFWITLYIID